jgi:probable HAF family extracellular repeat protein
MKYRLAALSATLFLGVAASAPVAAQTYTLTFLQSSGSPPFQPTTFDEIPSAINASGQIVGTSFGAAAEWNPAGALAHLSTLDGTPLAINEAGQIAGSQTNYDTNVTSAAVRNGGTTTLLAGPAGSTGSAATAINDASQVAGHAKSGSGQQAVVWNGGSPTVLAGLGGGNDDARGINNAGQVVGYSTTVGGATAAVTWSGTTFTTLADLGGSDSKANAINAVGQIAGYSSDGSFAQAVIWNGVTPTVLASLGHSGSQALDINDEGQAVGWSTAADGTQHAVLWNGTSVVDLSNLFYPHGLFGSGGLLLQATGINDDGTITGFGTLYRQGFVGWELTVSPVPEPDAFGLGLAGLAFVGLVAHRRRAPR